MLTKRQLQTIRITSIGLTCAVVWLLACGGCAKWSHLSVRENDTLFNKPKTTLAEDTVLVETIFLRVDEEISADLGKVVDSLDASIIGIDARRRLDANGLFAGLVRGEVPAKIKKWVDAHEARFESDLLEQASLRADVDARKVRWQCRRGQLKEIAVKPQNDAPLAVLRKTKAADGSFRVHGERLDLPALNFQMYAEGDGSGAARLRLTPEIKHGAPQSTYVSSGQAFRRELRKQSTVFGDLTIDTTINPGEILLVCGTQNPKGVGQHFFTANTVDGQQQAVILLMRLAAVSDSALFDTE